MRSVWIGIALALAIACAAAEPPGPTWREPPQYDERDPYYSDEFDAFNACAKRQAPSYRYDYDRPEVSSAEQVAEFLRRTCGKEIEALAKLVSPLEKYGGPEEMTGALDELVVGPYFERFDLPPSTVTPAPGVSEAWDGKRVTYFHAARGFGPDELVAVERTDAFDAPNYIFSFDQRFSYAGTRDGWRYRYSGSYGEWRGGIEKDGVSAEVGCSPASNGPVSYGDQCGLTVARLISLRADGKRLYPVGLCNPGDFAESDVSLRPLVFGNSARATARSATLSIDGGAPMALPDGDACKPLRPDELARIAHANHLHTSFIGKYDTRTVVTDGDGAAVAKGLELLAWLHARTFEPRTRSETRADQETLYRRALPFTLRDALLPSDEWQGSVRCIAAAAARGGGSEAAIDAAMRDPACANWLADVVWRGASFASERTPPADQPEAADNGAAKVAAVRALVRSEVVTMIAQGWRPQERAHFAESEAAAHVMGHAGFAGRAPALSDNYGRYMEPFGYAIDGRKAWGVVPSSFFNGFNEKPPTQSMLVTCDADHAPACTITIPTDDRKGAFVLHTDGTWHGAMTCMSYGNHGLAGWRIYEGDYSNLSDSALLDEKGCVTEHQAMIARAIIAQNVGPVIVEPGGEPFGKPTLLTFQQVPFALALTRFLAERVTEGR